MMRPPSPAQTWANPELTQNPPLKLDAQWVWAGCGIFVWTVSEIPVVAGRYERDVWKWWMGGLGKLRQGWEVFFMYANSHWSRHRTARTHVATFLNTLVRPHRLHHQTLHKILFHYVCLNHSPFSMIRRARRSSYYGHFLTLDSPALIV